MFSLYDELAPVSEDNRLTLGVLRSFAGSPESSLLPLFNSGVSGKQSLLAEYWPQTSIDFYQSSSNTMRNSTTLPRHATPVHLNLSIVLANTISNQKRL